jgi:hypothetical protein
MTIAAAFVCSDGILLASDTLYSAGTAKKYGRKFWAIERGDILVVFGGAGNEAALRRTRDEIEAHLSDGMTRQQVIECIDSALAYVESRLQTASQYDKTQALVVIRLGDGPELFEADRCSMLSAVDYPSQCVGFDAGLGFYFARSLFHPGMEMRWAKVVAAHMVKHVKRHSAWSGGSTNLVEIPDVGDYGFIDKKSQIAEHQKYLEELDDAMRLVLPRKDVSDDELARRLGVLNDTIRILRQSAKPLRSPSIGSPAYDEE